MRHISPPVAATCDTGAVASCSAGNENTPTRAPSANPPRVNDSSASNPKAIEPASGASTSAPPTNVITDLPPRNPANAGYAWPTIAAATAAYATQMPPSARPASAASVPFSASPTNAGQARAQPSCSSAFQAPGLPSPVRYRSVSWRRATSSDTGTEPSR